MYSHTWTKHFWKVSSITFQKINKKHIVTRYSFELGALFSAEMRDKGKMVRIFNSMDAIL